MLAAAVEERTTKHSAHVMTAGAHQHDIVATIAQLTAYIDIPFKFVIIVPPQGMLLAISGKVIIDVKPTALQ